MSAKKMQGCQENNIRRIKTCKNIIDGTLLIYHPYPPKEASTSLKSDFIVWTESQREHELNFNFIGCTLFS